MPEFSNTPSNFTYIDPNNQNPVMSTNPTLDPGSGTGGAAASAPAATKPAGSVASGFNPQWLTGVTSQYTNDKGTINSTYNPLQFATQDTAQQIAQMYGGNVENKNLGMFNFSDPWAMVRIPGLDNPVNAGLAAQQIQKIGMDAFLQQEMRNQRESRAYTPPGQSQSQPAQFPGNQFVPAHAQQNYLSAQSQNPQYSPQQPTQPYQGHPSYAATGAPQSNQNNMMNTLSSIFGLSPSAFSGFFSGLGNGGGMGLGQGSQGLTPTWGGQGMSYQPQMQQQSQYSPYNMFLGSQFGPMSGGGSGWGNMVGSGGGMGGYGNSGGFANMFSSGGYGSPYQSMQPQYRPQQQSPFGNLFGSGQSGFRPQYYRGFM